LESTRTGTEQQHLYCIITWVPNGRVLRCNHGAGDSVVWCIRQKLNERGHACAAHVVTPQGVTVHAGRDQRRRGVRGACTPLAAQVEPCGCYCSLSAHLMYLVRKRLWNSDRSVSLIKVCSFLSFRAQFLKTTSSSHLFWMPKLSDDAPCSSGLPRM